MDWLSEHHCEKRQSSVSLFFLFYRGEGRVIITPLLAEWEVVRRSGKIMKLFNKNEKGGILTGL